MSFLDRLFRRGRGGADSRRAGTADAATPLYSTPPPTAETQRDDAGGREGDVEPSVQEIQVGEEGASQQIDVGDSGGSDSGGSDSAGGGGDGGGGGGGE